MRERARTYQRGLFVAPLCVALALICRTALPSFGSTASANEAPQSLITGRVSGERDVIRVGGRRVTAVDLATGDRVTAITSGSGDYTMVLVPGRYRIEIDHSSMETVTRSRSELTVGASDLHTDVNIRIGVRAFAPPPARIYQPPLPTGAPIV